MNEEIKKDKNNAKCMFTAVAICEVILAVLIISSGFVLKYFFRNTYMKSKKWYCNNIMTQTYISEIVKGAENEY